MRTPKGTQGTKKVHNRNLKKPQNFGNEKKIKKLILDYDFKKVLQKLQLGNYLLHILEKSEKLGCLTTLKNP